MAGQFAGWNFGLNAGFASFVIAAVLMAIMCFGLALCVAELATMLPGAGGLHSFYAQTFGPMAGTGVGLAIAGASQSAPAWRQNSSTPTRPARSVLSV